MSDFEGRDKNAWHLDKRIPIGLILGLLAQAGVGVWVASKIVQQVTGHERRIETLEVADSRINDEARRISEYLARLDERMQAQTAILRRVEDALRPVNSTRER